MSLSIHVALQWGREELSVCSATASLDAELLLAATLNKSCSYLLAFPEYILTATEENNFKSMIGQRRKKMPIAYLLGHKEFWSLDYTVTPDTLIPRPETELLVELVLQKLPGDQRKIADLGTGSGAIAIAVAHERPHWIVHATDVSEAALEIAKLNATCLQQAHINFFLGRWCEALPHADYDAIISNPPYLKTEEYGEDLRFEPSLALVADDTGLLAIEMIVKTARDYLRSSGYLMIEHGCNQAAAVRRLFEQYGYQQIEHFRDLAGLERVTLALLDG